MLAASQLYQHYRHEPMVGNTPSCILLCFFIGVFGHSALVKVQYPELGSNFFSLIAMLLLLAALSIKLGISLGKRKGVTNHSFWSGRGWPSRPWGSLSLLPGVYDGLQLGADIHHAEHPEDQHLGEFETSDREVGFAGRLDHAGLYPVHQYHDDAAHRQKAVQFARQGAQQGECHTEPEEQQHPHRQQIKHPLHRFTSRT